VAGDWDHTGNLRIGVFRNGTWIVDMGGCNCYGSGAATYSFGEPGDQAVVGRWALGSDATHLNMGVLSAGMWYVDANGSGGWDGGDAIYSYGLAGDIPVMGTLPAGASQQYLLTTSAGPGGSISPAPGSYLYGSGTVVQISATPNAGYQFSGFTGALTGVTTPQYLTINAPESVTANFTAGQTLSITSGANLPGGTVSAAYWQQLAASGGVPPYTWSVISGGLPPGLSLAANGTLSGTPSAAGSYTFTVRVTDSNSATATQQFSVTVNAAPPETISAPAAPGGPPIALVGPIYALTASGAVSSLGHAIQYRFSWGDGSDSGWLPVGTAAAIHAWTAVGNYQVTLLARCATDYVVSPVSGTLQVSVQDFSLVANYSYAPVFAGHTVSVPVATTCANGFADNTLTITSVSYGNGAQALQAVMPPQFSNWYPACGSSTTITIQVFSSALPGYYQVTVTASGTAGGQSVQRSATLAVSVVTSQASGLVATPYAQTVTQGGSAWFSMALILTNGFSGTVSLSCSSPSPLCPSVTFNPSSLSGSATSTMTVTTAADTPPGAYTINVSGTSPGQNTVSTSVVLTVSSTTVLTLSPPLPPPTVPANGQPVSATYNFSSGNPNWLIGSGCTCGDSNVSAQVAQYGSSSAGLNVVVSPGDNSHSGTVDCPWNGGGGWGVVHLPIVISPAPVISSVTDAAGDPTAVLYAGGTATITINGANFGSAGGQLFFCTAGASPCVLPGNATPMSYNFSSCSGCSWTDNQIVTTVTLPSTAPGGAWQMFVISLAWLQSTAWSNPSMGNLQVYPTPTVTITRQSLTQFTATGSPQGGSFAYGVGCLIGSCPGPEPLIAFSPGVTAQTNPNTAVLTSPTNSCTNQVPCPGTLAGVTATYTLPDPILILNATAQSNVATFGMSCYMNALETDYMNGPGQCSNGQSQTNPPNVTGTFCSAFLSGVKLQGSGFSANGTALQYDVTSGTYYFPSQNTPTGADGPLIAGQTVARNFSTIPRGQGWTVTVDGVRTDLSLRATDTGDPGYITAYRLDLFNGAGKSACANYPNPMGVAACSPGGAACPGSAIQ